uniref:DUF1643 domain-containing protein n=1 Tax=viral metagenome TaxID=1070528 RepID=A0A6C0H8R8_9ZZZZ
MTDINYRMIYTISANETITNKIVIILCNPASVNSEDNTIKLLKTLFNTNDFNSLIILNLFSFVAPNLLKLDNLDITLFFNNQEENLNYISNYLETNNSIINKIIISCGQHFTRSQYKNIYKNHYNKLLCIIKNYSNKVYCYGFTRYKYPIYISYRNLRNTKIAWSPELILFFS